MKCDKAGCKDDIVPGSEGWGWQRLRCEKHFMSDGRGMFNETAADNLEARFRRDYFRLALMFQPRDGAIKQCMLALAVELSNEQRRAAADGNVSLNKHGEVRFSAILAKYENMCWFPPSHHVFLGFAEPANFQSMLRQGILAKDPGAGPKHGDFSHRLQWHAVSRIITDSFTTPRRAGWDNSPLELLSSFGSPWAIAANAWAVIFEKNWFWGNPDELNEELQKANYVPLSTQIARRTQKRFDQYHAANPGSDYREDLKTDRAHAYFEATARGVNANLAAKQKFGAGRYQIDRQYQNKRPRKLRTRTPAGVEEIETETEIVTGEPVATTTRAGAVKDVMPIDQRIALSRRALCVDDGVFCEKLGILSRRRAHPYDREGIV
jgi:hypothetical protein